MQVRPKAEQGLAAGAPSGKVAHHVLRGSVAMAGSIDVPLVVSLLGPPGAEFAPAVERAAGSLFAGGAESLLAALDAFDARSPREGTPARLPLLILTLDDPGLVAWGRAAVMSARTGGHDARLYVLRVGGGDGPAPEGADRLWHFPTAAKEPHRACDLLAAGAWLALRAQVRLFVGSPGNVPPRATTPAEALLADPAAFWEATARAGRLWAEEPALAPFYDVGHRPFQPPVRRLDEAERGLVARLAPDGERSLEPLSQLGLPEADSHHGHDPTWEQQWAADHLGPIARWNGLPLHFGEAGLESSRPWRNLWTADGAEPDAAPTEASVRDLAAAYCRVSSARKAQEQRSNRALALLLGRDWGGESPNVVRQSLGLLFGSVGCVSFAACVAFACYAKLYPAASTDPGGFGQLLWACVFAVLGVVAASLVFLPGNQDAKRIEEDLRALREALRVQVFFWMSRNPEVAADQFPRAHRGRLGAVRMGAANLALASMRTEDWPTAGPTANDADRVRRLWVVQQRRRYVGSEDGHPHPAIAPRKQNKAAQLEVLEASAHGVAQGLTWVALMGAPIHGLRLLGRQEWMPLRWGALELALAIAIGIVAAGVAYRHRLHAWIDHHHGLHAWPVLVGVAGGLSLIGVWMGLCLLLYPLGAGGMLRVGAKNIEYWWVSGSVLAGLLAGVLHARHHLLNLGSNLASARMAGALHLAADRALVEIIARWQSADDAGARACAREFLAYTREVGRIALAEDSRWLLDHRARPFALPHLT